MFDSWVKIFSGDIAPTPFEGKVMLVAIVVLSAVCLLLEWRLIRQRRKIEKLVASSPEIQVDAIKPNNH